MKYQIILTASAFALSACGGGSSTAVSPTNPSLGIAQNLVSQIEGDVFFDDITEVVPEVGNATYNGSLLFDDPQSNFVIVGETELDVDFSISAMNGGVDEFFLASTDGQGTVLSVEDTPVAADINLLGTFQGAVGTLSVLGTISDADVVGELNTAFTGDDFTGLEGVGIGTIDGSDADIRLRTTKQ